MSLRRLGRPLFFFDFARRPKTGQIESISRSMRPLFPLLALCVLFSPPLATFAQSPYVPAYQGLQPDLIVGVEQGLATRHPKVRHVYAATESIVGLIVDAQAIPRLPVRPYFKQPGDQMQFSRPQPYGTDGRVYYGVRTIVRDGKALGTLHGPRQDHYSPANRLEGDALDLTWASRSESYRMFSDTDAEFKEGVAPIAIHRKSKPLITEYTDSGKRESAARHELFLRFSAKLKPGTFYRLQFLGDGRPSDGVFFQFDDHRLRSEAIHVNHVGYHPAEPEKVALASLWLGDGGAADLTFAKTFHVVEDYSRRIVFTGPVVLHTRGVAGVRAPESETAPTADEQPMDVMALDFSALRQPGRYRVVIPGLGSSFAFEIREDIWEQSTLLSAKGIYTHRSGIEIGPPHSVYKRPRNMHPADGFQVHLTDPALFFDNPKFPAGARLFHRIGRSLRLDTQSPDAWGGWHDAADYDRSLAPQEHHRGTWAFLELYATNPAYFEKLNLNIPESNNALPDVIDEALWNLDFWIRVQQEDGGVPSNVESIEHPSEPSWLLTQPTAVTPPTPQSCYMHAGAAAQASFYVRPYDQARAERYLESALRAVEWVRRNPGAPDIYSLPRRPTEAAENFAYAWLYRATGDQVWHDAFKKTLPSGNEALFSIHPYTGPWGAAAYAFFPRELVDREIQVRCIRAIVAEADARVANTERRPYNLPLPRNWGDRLGFGWEFVYAHRLTGDDKYLLALVRQNQFSLGRNPHNASYTWGLGHRNAIPFNLDAFDLGEPFPDGVTSWGPLPNWMTDRFREATLPAYMAGRLHPANYAEWPLAEAGFDVRFYAFNEYTVSTNMANILISRGYLAQHYHSAKKRP